MKGSIPSTQTPYSYSFKELGGYYQMQWDYIIGKSTLPYFVPMTAGWDKRPWGGFRNGNGQLIDPIDDGNGNIISAHDQSKSTPQEFEDHLRDGYDMISRNMDKTKGIGMLQCWNEFGEGAIIEPTVQYGFEYLEAVRRVFR